MEKVLIVVKKTKFELDLETYPDREFYQKITKLQNNSFSRIYESHIRQLESRRILQEEIFPKGTFIFREGLDRIHPNDFDLIIALGGDNHFTYVAHQILGSKILGCNSDTLTSRGKLLGFNPISLKETVELNWNDALEEEWSMIYGVIEYPNGAYLETVSCVNEISIRNSCPDLTSRYVIQYGDTIEEQKSSGLLLYTGAGSTGWYSSCVGLSESELEFFPKDANYFKTFSRELSVKAKTTYQLTDFVVDTKLTVISEMNGGICVDSLPERVYPFPPGTVATFQLSKEKLKIISKKKK